MARNVGDKLLWTVIAAAGIAAYWYVPFYLQHVNDLTTVAAQKPKAAKPQLLEDAEDSIKSSTIAELAHGPSHNISASAIRLAARRFIKNEQAKLGLLQDIVSKEWHPRDRALKGLQLLLQDPALKESDIKKHLLDETVTSALVTALIIILPEHDQDTTTKPSYLSPVRPPRRPAHERAIIEILLILLEEPRKYDYTHGYYIINAQPAIDAGIITDWLQYYPFPCSLHENRRYNFKKKDVVRLLEPGAWDIDDLPMARLVQMLNKMPQGAKQLVDAGLRSPSIHDRSNAQSRARGARRHLQFPNDLELDEIAHWYDDEDEDEEGELIEDGELMNRLQGGNPRSGAARSGAARSGAARSGAARSGAARSGAARSGAARSAGELSRQRRHRQAIVVAEAGTPLRAENILQRQPTQTELNWEQEVQGRQGELLRNNSRRSASSQENAMDHIARERIDGLEEGTRAPFQPPLHEDVDIVEADMTGPNDEPSIADCGTPD